MRTVRPDWPFDTCKALPGIHRAHLNPYGAVSVYADDYKLLGVKPGEFNFVCPYGQPGDRLWVRESMGRWEDGEWFYKADTKVVTVPSDRTDDVTALRVWAHHKESPHCPSIHMPRWASRIALEITKVRVERLQAIAEEDAAAEGTPAAPGLTAGGNVGMGTACYWYQQLWDSINAKRGFGWEANPWVWVIEFRRVNP